MAEIEGRYTVPESVCGAVSDPEHVAVPHHARTAVGLSELDHRVVNHGLQLGHNRGQQPVDAHGVAGGVRGGRGGGRGVGTPLVDEVDLQSVEVMVGDEPAANCSEVGSGFGQADVPKPRHPPVIG